MKWRIIIYPLMPSLSERRILGEIRRKFLPTRDRLRQILVARTSLASILFWRAETWLRRSMSRSRASSSSRSTDMSRSEVLVAAVASAAPAEVVGGAVPAVIWGGTDDWGSTGGTKGESSGLGGDGMAVDSLVKNSTCSCWKHQEYNDEGASLFQEEVECVQGMMS